MMLLKNGSKPLQELKNAGGETLQHQWTVESLHLKYIFFRMLYTQVLGFY